MENPSVPIHTSSNGDRWLLVRNPESGDVFVRHLPNAASGGKSSHIELEAFLLKKGLTRARELVANDRLACLGDDQCPPDLKPHNARAIRTIGEVHSGDCDG